VDGIRPSRENRRDQDQSHRDRDRPEPEGGSEIESLSNQCGDRIPDASTDGSGDRQGGDGTRRFLAGEVAARESLRHWQKPQADALQTSPDHHREERGGNRREHATEQHKAQNDLDDSSLEWPIGQPTHDRGGQCPRHQRGRAHGHAILGQQSSVGLLPKG
jgi:hypothetical protein